MISLLAWAMQPASRAGALHLWSLDEVEHYEQDWNHLQSRMKFTASLLINVVQSGDKDGVEHLNYGWKILDVPYNFFILIIRDNWC